MRKNIKIGGKDYIMQSSAYTPFKYKNDTGRKFLDDVNSVAKIREKKENDILSSLDDLLEILLQITFVMIEEADSKQVTSFEEFLKNIDNLFDDIDWINQVMELALTPISGGNKKVPQ